MAVFPDIQLPSANSSSTNVSMKPISTLSSNSTLSGIPNSITGLNSNLGSKNPYKVNNVVAGVVAGNNNTLMLMNKKVTSNDSLYYICLCLKKRLESVGQLKPYLNLAYSSAEVLSENQALLLSQKSGSVSSGSQPDQYASSLNHSNYRVSELSSFSNLSEGSSNNSSTLLNSPVGFGGTISTFSAGVLPASVNCDPVTQLWCLFQQGSPLCIIFNLIRPEYSLPVVSSDDVKICKKSIYDFILACKNYLKVDSVNLFTISNVFSNSTDDLIKIINVVNAVIDFAPHIFKKIEQDDEIKITDARSKVIKELVETERKYVNDLEILAKYKEQLLTNNIISSDDSYILFPNLSDILDFQRRFLVSLEINSLVDPKYQRIGSIFIHAQNFFKAYEPWAIGQKTAIDFISSSSMKLKNNSLIIGNDLELQSFILKPVQRLCKYPLLLRELVKYADPTFPNHNELILSLDIAKKIANDINENQRKVENVEVLKKLYAKVIDWKGYNINSFGELLFFDKVVVKDNSKAAEEREFQVYLFENIIIFFKEIYPQQKKSSITSLKKKSQTNLLNATQEVIGLELKGRISIANIYNISTVGAHSLNISWSGMKDTGSFLMRFKNEEVKNNWESCIRKLVNNLQEELTNSNTNSLNSVSLQNRRSNGISLNSNRSSYVSRKNSDADKFTHVRQKSEIPPMSKRLTQESIQNTKRSISESYKNTLPLNSVIVRLMYDQDLFTLMTPIDISVQDFLTKIEKKMKQCGAVMKGKVKYQDEDGDFIVIESEEDWTLVKEMMKEVGEKVLNVWVT